MEIIECADLSPEQKKDIISLWNNEYPAQLGYAQSSEFDNYLDKLQNKQHLLLIDVNAKVNGWALLFKRNNEIWFAIILDSSLQGQGYGTALINRLKSKGVQLNGWVTDHSKDIKANGQPYRSPLGFYLKHAFLVKPHIRLELEHFSAVKIEWAPTASNQ